MNFLSKYFREKIDGHIDVYTGDRIVGWIKRRKDVRPLVVDIYVNDACVAQAVVADRMRPDLKEAGQGSGTYGFDVPIAPVWMSQADAVVTVRLAGQAQASLTRRAADIPPLLVPLEDNVRSEEGMGAQVAVPAASSLASAAPRTSPYRLCIEHVRANEISGWAVDERAPGSVLRVRILVDGYVYRTVETSRPRNDLRAARISGGQGGFSVRIPLDLFEDGEHVVGLQAPDGTLEERTFETIMRRPPRTARFVPPSARAVTVIVPIHNAHDDLVTCIANLRHFNPAGVKVVLIDDGSTDPRIAAVLDAVEARGDMTVVRNPQNIGFTRTVNKGISASAPDDVIILNSDARVTPGWIEGLLFAAGSASRIATVTPMSDRAGAFSAPTIGNENDLPPGISEMAYARAFRRRSLGLYPSVPTGNGYCMFISRACIDEIGMFDAEAFPRGYGEENDFCMRARRAGWRNIIDDRTYVFHGRSKSFGDEKADLLAAGRAVLDSRYPDYDQAIRVFSASEEISLARMRAFQARQDCEREPTLLPRILFVTSTQTGGTPQTNRDLMAALDGAIDCWNLRCDSAFLELTHLVGEDIAVVRQHRLAEPVDPLTHRSAEYDAVVTEWLFAFDFDLVHIRHLAWHSLSLPACAKALGRKVIFSFHDFYALSPTVKLIDDTGAFRGDRFLPESSIYREALWPERSQPRPDGAWLALWRDQFEEALLPCDAFVTTSASARLLVLEHFKRICDDRFLVIPHGRDFPEFSRDRQTQTHGRPVRILLPGNINTSKGLEIVCRLTEIDRERLIEFHVLGNVSTSNLRSNTGIVRHGSYDRADFIDKVRGIKPHLGAVFSIWDETYCHTLTELWSAGLPVLVFDFPTVATRVRESGAGWVLDHHDVHALYRRIIDLAQDTAELDRAHDAVAAWQAGRGVGDTTRVMAARYFDVYRRVLREGVVDRPAPAIAVVCPGEGRREDGLASTHSRIWERTRNDLSRDVTYIRMTPEALLANLRSGSVQGAIVHRNAIPRTMVTTLLQAFDDSRVPYVFDIDDDLLEVPPEKDPRGAYADYAQMLRLLLAKADLVTVPTPNLLERMRVLNPEVTRLPSLLSARIWKAFSPKRKPDGTVRALVLGAVTPSVDLAMILPALDPVAASHPNFRLTVVGGTVDRTALEGRGGWLEHLAVPFEFRSYDAFVPWLQTVTETCDFAVAPLRDDPSNAYRSGVELLEYAALALPVLCSDVGAYRDIAAAAPEIAPVANSGAKWEAALTRCIRLGEGNRALGEANRRWVEETHMLGPTLADFDRIVIELAGRGRKVDPASREWRNASAA